MEPTQCSETSAFNTQTPGKYPEDNQSTYKLSKLFTLKIKQLTQLPYSFNIKNTTELIQELKQTPITPTSVLASLDITNMYFNIPIRKTKQILENILTSNSTDPQIKSELLNWYEVITKQNYFLNNNKIIIQTDSLAMGASSSSILSEIFLQNTEHTHLPCLARKHKLVNYFCFVDDILINYDSQHTNIHAILNNFNSIHPNLQFTEETEQNNAVNYLDITIHKTPTNINISIFRKPTFTDTLIIYTFIHPIEQKYAAIRFLYNRLNSYHSHRKEYRQKENIIHNILHISSYPLLPHKPKNTHCSLS
jgi:hypothetical protein